MIKVQIGSFVLTNRVRLDIQLMDGRISLEDRCVLHQTSITILILMATADICTVGLHVLNCFLRGFCFQIGNLDIVLKLHKQLTAFSFPF